VNIAPWTEEEDRLLLAKYAEAGPKWAYFRPFFRQRTVNNIKNRWHTLARRERLDAEKEGRTKGPLAMFAIANLLNTQVLC
jgi:hypothetical protein